MGEKGTREMLDFTRKKFGMFLEGNRALFWFEGRE
jgi:hypothetical protein